MSSDFKQSSHIHLVPDMPSDAHGLVRWVRIGDRAFAFTPSTCFKGITSNGEDYYPYYDDNLRTCTPPDDDDNYFDLRGYTL